MPFIGNESTCYIIPAIHIFLKREAALNHTEIALKDKQGAHVLLIFVWNGQVCSETFTLIGNSSKFVDDGYVVEIAEK